MQREDILDLLAYNRWANERILTQLERLSAEQLTAVANLDHGSAWQTLLHLVDVEWSWRLMAQRILAATVLWEVEDLSDLARVKIFWIHEQQTLLTYVQGINEAQLNTVVEYGTPQGWPARQAKLWQILAHVVNHSTQHRTELARYVTDCGYSPGDLSLLQFLSHTP